MHFFSVMVSNAFIEGEFVGLMFDEAIAADVRQFFESVLSHYSVFMAQPGTPTVSNHYLPHIFFRLLLPFHRLVW